MNDLAVHLYFFEMLQRGSATNITTYLSAPKDGKPLGLAAYCPTSGTQPTP